MYCCFSKLRRDGMSLKEIAEMLEVSQGEIAEAVGISKTTVNHYLDGTFTNPEKLDSIYRYLNSREFYCGYTFMPSKKFAEFLRDEVLSVFEKSMKLNDIAKAIGMSPQKLSKLKSAPESAGKIQKLTVREQYDILKKFNNMCEEDGLVPEQYQPLRLTLDKYIHMYELTEITRSFSSLLNYVQKFGYRSELFRALKEVCEADDEDIQRILQDDEFIMDLDARYRIISRVADQNVNAPDMDSVMERMDNITLFANFTRGDIDLFAYPRDIDCTSLNKYPKIIRRIILEYYYAFMDEAPSCCRSKDKKANVGVCQSAPCEMAEQRVRIVEEYHKLSVKNKSLVCEELTAKISEHMKQTGTEITPLKHEFDENGKLVKFELNCPDNYNF